MENNKNALTHNCDIWDNEMNIADIRRVFAPSLTDTEFKFFMGLGRATGLNPFQKEIWAVKYGSGAAQVFVGRDGYRKVALNHPDYDYHQCDCVYTNDLFEVVNGEVRHTYNMQDRGSIVGAYCITKRRRASKSVYHFVRMGEYSTGKSLWASKPEVMIKKVAESTALRATCQDVLGGTYIPEEMPEEMSVQKKPFTSQTDKLKQILESKNAVTRIDSNARTCNDDITDADVGDVPNLISHTPATNAQVQKIYVLIKEKEFSDDRVFKALAYYKVNSFSEMTFDTAQKFILKLEDM